MLTNTTAQIRSDAEFINLCLERIGRHINYLQEPHSAEIVEIALNDILKHTQSIIEQTDSEI